jgi:hypothetical protein
VYGTLAVRPVTGAAPVRARGLRGSAKALDACYAGPVFNVPTPVFTSVSGFVYLDFCTWNLEPANKCHDLSPPSADCASVADAGPDAGPASVCTH